MDVVANNVANINTNGFKADRSLFEEFLNSGAHEDNFARPDRRVSFVQDRGTFRDFAVGNTEMTKNPLDVAIDGGGFLTVQTPAGERYTKDGGLQINNQGQLVTAAGNPVLGTSGPIVFQPTDHDISIAADGNITVLEGTDRIDSVRGKLRLVSFRRRPEAGQGRQQSVTRPVRRRRRQPDSVSQGAPGLHREVERQLGDGNEPHDRDHAHLHPDFGVVVAAERPAQIRHRETRRRSGITARIT